MKALSLRAFEDRVGESPHILNGRGILEDLSFSIPLKGVKIAENIANQNANVMNSRVRVGNGELKNQKGWFQIIY